MKHKAVIAFSRANDNQARTRWDRGNFDAWQESLSPERREADRQSLAALFNLAAAVPELQDALDWAKDHDIRFFVDHTTVAGGYYMIGTGVVGISAACLPRTSYAVDALVHEIRHAWQDHYNMIPTTGKSFAGYFMRVALMEADATAHENVASAQFCAQRDAASYQRIADNIRCQPDAAPGRLEAVEKSIGRILKSLEPSRLHPEALWSGFCSWYSMRATSYGQNAERGLGSRLGIPGVTPRDFKGEYQPYEGRKFPLLEGDRRGG